MSTHDPAALRTGTAELAAALPAPDLGFHAGFYLPLNDVSLGEPGGAAVVANGNLAVSWGESTFDGTVDEDDELETFDGDVGLNGAVTIELAVDAGGELSGSLGLAMIPLAPFAVGPSILVSPFVAVTLRLAGSADAGARVSFIAPFRIDASFVSAVVAPGLPSRPRLTAEIGPPDPAQAVAMRARVEVEVAAAFMVAIEGIPVGGPVIGTQLGVAVTIDPGAPAWWDIDGLLKVVGGWAFPDPVTTFPDIPDELELLVGPVRRNLASADGPLPAIGAQSSRWSQVYDVGGLGDHAVAAVPVEDGLVVVEGGVLTPWLASLDGLGVPRRQELLSAITPMAMVSATDGDLVVAGMAANALQIDRYDPAGAPRWSRTLTVPEVDGVTCTALAATAGNGVVVGGAVNRGSVLTPIVAAIDEAGGVGWATEIDAGSGSTRPAIQALATTPAGEILAIGSVHFTDPVTGVDNEDALVVRLGEDGDARAAFALSGAFAVGGLRIAVHGDGSYAICGDRGQEPNAWIASLTADDGLLWFAAYQSRPDTGGIDVASPAGLAALPGKGLLVCGHIGAPDTDAWLMRVDANGMPVWLKTYRSDDHDELSGVVAVPDGLFAFGATGITEMTSSSTDLWVLRTSIDGMLRFSDASAIVAANTAAQWQRPLDHVLHVLQPSNIATTLDGEPALTPPAFGVDPASVAGEPLTD